MASSNSRLPPLDPASLTGKDKDFYNELYSFAHAGFGESGKLFTWADPETKALLGPFPAFQALPDFYGPIVAAHKTMGKIKGITPEAREVVLLVAGAHFKAAFELYAHTNVAVKTTELTQDQVDTMVEQQRKPSGLSPNAALAYDITAALLRSPGPLSRDLWDEGVRMYGGKEGLMGLVTYVAEYTRLSIVLNAMDAPLPE